MNTKRLIKVISLIVVTVAIPTTSFADTQCKTLNVAAAQIPHFIENENKGVFIHLIRTAAKRAGLKLTVNVYPKKRALRTFEIGRANSLLPHSSAGAPVPSYRSMPILIKRDFVFVRRGSPIPASIKELEGLHIGLTKQYAYPKSITSNTRILINRTPTTDENNIRMLSAGRLDGSIIEEASGLRAISEAAVNNVVYDKFQPINELQVWMLFSKNECGKKNMEKINSEFAAMKSDGTWQSIMVPSK